MLATNVPPKFNIPFANAAGGSYITYPLPQLSQIGIADGRASLTDGFPPLNFLPLTAGGVPPFGQDMNGIIKQITLWNQWQSAGGPIIYDAVFAAAIGGYPKGGQLASSLTPGTIWVSTVDGNATNPDSMSAANWVPVNDLAASQLQPGNYAVDTGATNAYVIAPSPALGSYPGGVPIRFIPSNTNTAASTINISALGAKAIVDGAGNPLLPGDIVAGQVCEIVYNATGNNFTKTSFTPAPQNVSGVTSGYCRIPGSKLILQWQQFTISSLPNNTNTISGTLWQQIPMSLPIGFPNGVIYMKPAVQITANGQCIFGEAQGWSIGGCTVYMTATSAAALPITCTMFAIGY